MMIKSVVFHFISENNGFLHKYNGPLFRAAFLKMVQNQNLSLASTLHDSSERKPYFLTSLKPEPFMNVKKSKNRREFLIKTGQKYYAKLNIFDEIVFKTVMSELFSTSSDYKKIRIGNISFAIEKIEVNSYSFKDLLTKEDSSSAKIVFRTPTFFKTTDGSAGIEYFPRPTILFKFILNQWVSFPLEKDHVPPENLLSWIKENVKISSFNIKTESSHVMKKVSIMGTVGWVKYSWNKQENISKWIPVLLKYSEYTGLGALRTAGYGEIEVKL